MVRPSSWALLTMPRPLRKATTGASIISASSRISSRASIAPLPTKIIGRLAARDQRRRLLDAVAVRQRRRERIERLCDGAVGALREHVPRHFQRHRTAAARHHLLERARHRGRRQIGIFDAFGPFDEGAQRRELVRHFVQMAAALAEKFRRHLSGQAQHRLVAAERGEQRRAGVRARRGRAPR